MTLDPDDWTELRALGHRMLDDMFDYQAQIRTRPVWQPIPDAVRESIRAAVPVGPADPAALYREFQASVLPYTVGNVHPGFMGWVNGGGTPIGMLAEMLAAGLNANLGGRDHMPIEVERLIVEWMRQLFGFPEGTSGLFVTGTSMANLIAVLVARSAFLGTDVRRHGLSGNALCAYTSAAAHGCAAQAFEIAGFGSDALRRIAFDERQRMDIAALHAAIAADKAAGLTPFLVIATAGTVDVGAIDDLSAIAALCRAENIHLHIDGAYGALGIMSPEIAPLLKGIELADSIAFDFHKWGQVPYDAGFILVRDGPMHLGTFASPAAYLKRETRGLAAGSPWPCDLGPDLSRGFRALKTWFTLKTYGTERLGAMMADTCKVARYLEARVRAEPDLEVLAPAQLNIVCFRFRGSDTLNEELVVAVQESGIAAPSSTTIDGRFTIRCAIVNHRTEMRDIDALLEAVLRIGRDLSV